MRKLLLISSNTIHTYKYLQLIEDYFDEVLLITNEKSNVYDYPTVELNFNLKIKTLFSTVKEIKKQIELFQPSIIHIHQANSYAFFALLACRKSFIPTVLTAWGSDVLLLPKSNLLLKKMVQFNLRNAYFLTSDSIYMAQEMEKIAPLKNRIIIANFGIDVTPISCEKENIIYSNRLHKKLYRVDKIIEAFSLFYTNNNSDWKLVIAATGTETEKLKIKVAELNLDHAIEFVGWIQKEDNEQWYSKAKIWVSIPESDATSISLLEAMACGCIPVVSDLPANREWIQSGRNGIVVENLDSDFLSEALLLNQSEAIELNQKRIEQDGTKEANRTKFTELYQRILEQ
ncbi:MAG: glycosyltransferase family 4 protein [Crocinitomicaceae bacterium]|nr:glycosyltransferase family 4 protein [Crocinitomicaceae bacterium]